VQEVQKLAERGRPQRRAVSLCKFKGLVMATGHEFHATEIPAENYPRVVSHLVRRRAAGLMYWSMNPVPSK
jgi:hypothetical protein